MNQENNEDWNVLTSPWLEVTDLKANPFTCSPMEALRRASEIKCLSFSSPLDQFAAHRFLLTLFYWKAESEGGVENLRKQLMDGKIPHALLENIEDEVERFELFHEKAPFLQDTKEDMEKAKLSSGSFFAEIPVGTYISHFYHCEDHCTRLCLKCLTMGMLRLIPWTQMGGKGKSPSVHSAPPIRALAIGKNLAITLGLNLVKLSGEPGKAKWTGEFNPRNRNGPIEFLDALTWNPRIVRIPKPAIVERCKNCGTENVLGVEKIVFNINPNTKMREDKKTFEWEDPSAFYRPKKEFTTLKSMDESLASNGKDILPLLKLEELPKSRVVEENKNHGKWSLIVPCTNKAKTFDHRQFQVTCFDPEILKEQIPLEKKQPSQTGMDGWEPPQGRASTGEIAFVKNAVRDFSNEDWDALLAASFREMHEAPRAFSIMTSLLWPLRKKTKGAPSKKVSWLILKLMASMPSSFRNYHPSATFNPIYKLGKRQKRELKKGIPTKSKYPVNFPTGTRLEAELKRELEKNMRSRTPKKVDWVGLCSGLDEIIG